MEKETNRMCGLNDIFIFLFQKSRMKMKQNICRLNDINFSILEN